MKLRPLAWLGCHGRLIRRKALVPAAASAILVALVLLVGGAIRAEPAATSVPSIVVGTKSSPEDSILGQLYVQALEARGFKVVYKQGIGSARVADKALRSGKIDVYPEYTGVIVRTLFHRTLSTKTAAATYRLAKKLQETHGVTLLNPTPFVRASSAGRFGAENVVPVVRKAFVTELGSRFMPTLNALSARLTLTAIRKMNDDILVGKQSPVAVAKAFLNAHRLISSANVFVASTGSDTGARCKRFAAPVVNPDASGTSVCKSFAKAYLLADAGDTVEVQAGDYPSQTIAAKSRAADPNVVIRPAAGANVAIDDLTTNGEHLTIEDLTVRTGTAHNRGWRNNASDVTLDGVAITGPYARVDIGGGATDVTWKNGSLGTPGNTVSRVCGLDGGSSSDPQPVEISRVSNLTFSNLDFYPFIAELSNSACGPDGVMHLETIRVNDGVENFRLERSRFHRGDGSGTARLFVTRLAGRNSDNLTVVNNWFGASDGKGGGSVSVYLGGNQACVNYVFAYNQFEQGFVPDCNPVTDLKLVGNTGVGPAYLCEGTSHVKNLWTWSSAGSCGTDRWVRDANFSLAALRYAPDGYHLLPRSPAINAGDTTECAALTGGLDIDGQPRTGPCDAGPDEFKKP